MQAYGRAILPADAERALRLIQKLDPKGVGARSVQECLMLQLEEDMMFYDELTVLIPNHLEDLAANRLPLIQRKTGFDLETITAAAEELAQLDPHPGREYRETRAQAVTPDLAVDRDEDGNYSVRHLDEYTPSLRISKYYIKQLRNSPDAATKEYIKKKIEGARWLIESIEQRNNTVKRVTEAIVEHQKDFLDRRVPSTSTPSRWRRSPTRSGSTSRRSPGPSATSGCRRRGACSRCGCSSAAAPRPTPART